MKKTVLICVVLTLLSCKSNKDSSGEGIIEPEYVLKKWERAIKNLDYERYVECEAYPRSHEEFLRIYKDHYFEDILVKSVEFSEKNEIDNNLDRFNRCEVVFDGIVVNRENDNAKRRIQGNVDFKRYIDLPISKQTWLMFNRTLIETNL